MQVDQLPGTAAPSPEDIAAVTEVPQRIMAAWAAQDGERFAEIFTEDGIMVLPGQCVKGRGEIARFMSGAFQGPYRGTQVTGTPFNVAVLSDTVVVLHTQGGVLGHGESEVSDARAVRAIWTVVRVDGDWQLAAYQNTPRDTP
ncbi:SgcJ/EcaC family oxidoreductase [Myceligenerans indicum]|uniref:SgcJ/EcaC family oxidoreductase n=1 Tax=Myceligenerans indicum TaxID=2593663 RepID=A0ABS1LHC0_9MICO|nr:SgcJ/EcaC family oxidoreductase [Myceligenerans indicum]MBL0885625.1 SgcJ/EcaC family oxidoreductase [Myceligenerans indicum]